MNRDMPLRRTTGLARSTTPVRQRRPAKPGDRAVEEIARMLVWARASQPYGYALCEVCGDVPPTNYQHRKARAHCSTDERWATSNGLAVCGHGNLSGCHGRIHQQPALAYRMGWSVRSNQTPADVPTFRRGEFVLLDNHGSLTRLETPS